MSNTKGVQKATEGTSEVSKEQQPRSLPIAAGGIRTSEDFASMMSALMSDVIEGRVTPGVSNAAVNAGGKLLKIVELQLKYGTSPPGTERKTLLLCGEKSQAQTKRNA